MVRWFETSVLEISMRIDLYTKAVLTVIALLLAAIVFKQYISPNAVALAQGPFAGVQYSSDRGGPTFFDTRTGEVWAYYIEGTVRNKYRVSKLGQPLVIEK
jgi:hypothetical protein